MHIFPQADGQHLRCASQLKSVLHEVRTPSLHSILLLGHSPTLSARKNHPRSHPRAFQLLSSMQRRAVKISALFICPRLSVLPLLILRGHICLSPHLVPFYGAESGVCAQVTEGKPPWIPIHVTRWRQRKVSVLNKLVITL